MKYIVPAALVVAAIIHLLPLSGVLGAAQLEKLYGLPIGEPNLEILMRHRAVLFGLLGGFLLVAAFRPELHGMALAAGMASVISFLYLAWSVGGYNAAIGRVFTVDLVALVCLVAGGIVHLYSRFRYG